MLRAARSDPTRLTIGIDANASAMRAAAHRAARRGNHLPNAVFVVAAAESLPEDLTGAVDLITVQFPWGSLLRGIVGPDGPVLPNLARIAAPGASLVALWSIVDRDRAEIGRATARPAEERFGAAGFEIQELRAATTAEVVSSGSTWAKRLRAGADRPVTLLRAVRR